MKLIPLTKGYVAVVDAADWEKLVAFKWHVREDKTTNYAARSERGKEILMHHEVLGTRPPAKADHKNSNGLDNRRLNLRPCSTIQNGQNRKKNLGLKFKGVSFHKRDGKFQARIKANGKRIQLGYFNTEQQAVQAYDNAAVALFGEWAKTNE